MEARRLSAELFFREEATGLTQTIGGYAHGKGTLLY